MDVWPNRSLTHIPGRVETICRNVKRWRGGDQIERLVDFGLLIVEQQFRNVIGYRQIPSLLSSIARAV
jgi:hypothetical protein